MNRQLIEAASWRLISELFRRFPGKFKLIETHPGGGMYDCLTLFDNHRHVADFNRVGSLHVFDCNEESSSLDIWPLFAEENPRAVLDQVCVRLGLKAPAKLPHSTTEVSVYRFVAAFLSHAVFGREKWECRNGFMDSSGMDENRARPEFDLFPRAKERLRIFLPGDPFQNPAYRFWFLMREGIPCVCLETTGTAWTTDPQATFDLMALYQQEKKIWPVVWAVAGHLLP